MINYSDTRYLKELQNLVRLFFDNKIPHYNNNVDSTFYIKCSKLKTCMESKNYYEAKNLFMGLTWYNCKDNRVRFLVMSVLSDFKEVLFDD